MAIVKSVLGVFRTHILARTATQMTLCRQYGRQSVLKRKIGVQSVPFAKGQVEKYRNMKYKLHF